MSNDLYEGTGRRVTADNAFGSMFLIGKCCEWGLECNLMMKTNAQGWANAAGLMNTPEGLKAAADSNPYLRAMVDKVQDSSWQIGDFVQSFRDFKGHRISVISLKFRM